MDSVREILNPNSALIFNDNLRDAFNTPVNYPELIKNELYNSYSYLTTNINRVIGTAAGIVWETHKRWLEFKAKDPDKYIKSMKEFSDEIMKSEFLCPPSMDFKKLEEVTQEGYTSFGEFVDWLYCGSYGRVDVAMLFYPKGYIETVNELRESFFKDESTVKFISFDIENVHDFVNSNITTGKKFNFCDSIAFKVKPELIGIDRLIDGEISSARPIAKYNVCLDINKIISLIARNFFRPAEVPAPTSPNDPSDPAVVAVNTDIDVDKDTFVSKVIEKYNTLPDRIAKFISVDILNLEKKISSEWGKFIEQLGENFNEIYDSQDYKSLSDLITHVIHRSGLKVDHGEPICELFGEKPISNVNTINTLLTNIIKRFTGNASKLFAEKLMNCISIAEDGEYEYFLNEISYLLFSKTFAVYFESDTLVDFLLWNCYYKPLNEPYDIESLKEAAATISDYDKRDFFTTMINFVDRSHCDVYNTQKTMLGDVSRKYTLLKRQTWCWLFAYINIYFTAAINYRSFVKDLDFGSIEQNSRNLYNKLNESIINYFSKGIHKGIKILSIMGNEIGAPYWREFYIANRFGINDKLFEPFKVINDPLLIFRYGSNISRINSMRVTILDKIETFLKEKYGETYFSRDNLIMSFDLQELGNVFDQWFCSSTQDFIDQDIFNRLINLGFVERDYD